MIFKHSQQNTTNTDMNKTSFQHVYQQTVEKVSQNDLNHSFMFILIQALNEIFKLINISNQQTG